MSAKLDSHTEQLNELQAGQREHSKVLESHSKVLESHTKQLGELQDGQRTIVGLLTTLIDRTKPAG